jgi:3-deoxy-D-manno-octulosonic-acid transferase
MLSIASLGQRAKWTMRLTIRYSPSRLEGPPVNRFLYSLVFYSCLPLIFLRLCWRSLKVPAYRERWRERFGFYGGDIRIPEKPGCVLFHAVSVGEVHAAIPLVKKLLVENPDTCIAFSTSTPTGTERVKAVFGNEVLHFYLPFDLPGAIVRFLAKVRPAVLVVMETELWPNLLHQCREDGIRVLLANARMSARSRRRYHILKGFVRGMLKNIDMVAAQSQEDGRRFVELGLPSERMHVTGSMKFDMEIPATVFVEAQRLRNAIGVNRPVLIAASTREGEDEKVLEAFQRVVSQIPDAFMILVPRHPERFHDAVELCRATGHEVARRSSMPDSLGDYAVLVGDSMGEMLRYYAAADIAFVGGSLVNTGCQNILEPAALGLPVLTGPSLFNFKAVSELLLAGGGMAVVPDAAGLADLVVTLFQSESRRTAMGEAASRVVETNRGATDRLLYYVRLLADLPVK